MDQLYRSSASLLRGDYLAKCRAVFSRVRYCSRSLHLTNLFLLLTSALIPFPTAVLSAALQIGSSFDAVIAVELYEGIGGLMCLSWLLVLHVLSINPHLVESHVELTFFPQKGTVRWSDLRWAAPAG